MSTVGTSRHPAKVLMDTLLDPVVEAIAERVAEIVAARLATSAPIQADDELPESADTKQAARFLGLATQTMKTMRLRGGGPEYFKIGSAVRYRRDVLRAFRAKRLRRNTSQKP